MRCPCCLSSNLENIKDINVTHCCEACGCSFELTNPPQDVLLEERRKTRSDLIKELADEYGIEVIDIRGGSDGNI